VNIERCVRAITLGHWCDLDWLGVGVELSSVSCGGQHKFVHGSDPPLKGTSLAREACDSTRRVYRAFGGIIGSRSGVCLRGSFIVVQWDHAHGATEWVY
jgi:hypothetical protein